MHDYALVCLGCIDAPLFQQVPVSVSCHSQAIFRAFACSLGLGSDLPDQRAPVVRSVRPGGNGRRQEGHLRLLDAKARSREVDRVRLHERHETP